MDERKNGRRKNRTMEERKKGNMLEWNFVNPTPCQMATNKT